MVFRIWFQRVLALMVFLVVSGSEAAPKPAIAIGLIGDSTVATTYGWGPAFARRCKSGATVLNYAKNGATLDS